VTGPDRRDLGRLFNEVPELYDRVRPAYPDELFADLVAITGTDERSSVLEVGCLLDAIAERIRTQMGDRAVRRYLSVLRIGRRAD
jgi:hypothetical protein